MLITFCPGRGSNQDPLRANPTLYRVAVKAGMYRKAIRERERERERETNHRSTTEKGKNYCFAQL